MAGMKKTASAKAAPTQKNIEGVRAARLRRQEAFDKLPIEKQRAISNKRKAALAGVRERRVASEQIKADRIAEADAKEAAAALAKAEAEAAASK